MRKPIRKKPTEDNFDNGNVSFNSRQLREHEEDLQQNGPNKLIVLNPFNGLKQEYDISARDIAKAKKIPYVCKITGEDRETYILSFIGLNRTK